MLARPTRAKTMRLADLPLELWEAHVSPGLGDADVGRLAQTCRRLRRVCKALVLSRGQPVRTRTGAAHGAILKRWAPLVGVVGLSSGSLRPPRLAWTPRRSCPALRRLEVCGMKVAPGFWTAAAAACPLLDDVKWTGAFSKSSATDDITALLDLVIVFAPRLRVLDVGAKAGCPDGYHIDVPPLCPVARESWRRARAVLALRPIRCPALATLVDRRLGGLVALDCPALERMRLVLPGDERFAEGYAAVESLEWEDYPSGFDAAHLASRFPRLRHLGLRLRWGWQSSFSWALATLGALPATLRTLHLELHTSGFLTDVVGVPLAGLTNLERLSVRMESPPRDCSEFLGTWFGAHAGVSEVGARFGPVEVPAGAPFLGFDGDSPGDEEESHDDESARIPRAAPLLAWLDAHPRARARVRGLGPRFSRHHHPRLACS